MFNMISPFKVRVDEDSELLVLEEYTDQPVHSCMMVEEMQRCSHLGGFNLTATTIN